MNRILPRGIVLAALFLSLSVHVTSAGQSEDPRLSKAVTNAIQQACEQFKDKKIQPEEIAVSVIDLTDTNQLKTASFRGDARIYPASVVKLFYLVAAHQWLEDGKMAETAELRRAMRDMIVDSSNDATHYVVDALTGTTSGPELPLKDRADWEFKRNAVNRYFVSRGYTNMNANQKPWCEGPYGRERIFVGEKYSNRNALTTDATARLLSEIALGKAVSPERSRQMLDLLKRDTSGKNNDPDDQAHGFSAAGLPPGARLWSKAGWTSDTRHDAAYAELPDGQRIVLVIFTINHATDREIIPSIVRHLLAAER
jgi:beta-lactamase class A